ncbi:13843_t:CDS:2 [Funneliformis geosporum]|uniref:13843_t:CDS:1 n=1 Tax=Funneliformis geosporum TaxID=1117311 RepID=A0A9W4SD84_9GLOM|nr:13843_t:CDS:2 [Funneliformis geosporum]
MAIENEGLTKKINEMYRYVLRLYDRLINGQKTLVTLIEVQIFFDILVSDRETPDECDSRKWNPTLWMVYNKQIYKQESSLTRSYSCSHLGYRDPIRELSKFAEVLDLNHNVFMICMTLYWKDDPKL